MRIAIGFSGARLGRIRITIDPGLRLTPLQRRLLWFAGLYVASVAALGVVALGVRAVLGR